MILGITETIQENKRVAIIKEIRKAAGFFIFSALLPFAIFLLFYSGIITGKPIFISDIQEPVAKVITSEGVGTAFLVSPTILLTARHVVENHHVGDFIELIFEQSKSQLKVEGRIKFISPSSTQTNDGQVTMDYFLTDIAVLEVSEITDIEPLLLGESDVINNLDEVILIGYPNGDYSISKGNINSDKFQGYNLFKLDAVSNPGNSGGPCILTDDNTVIGILVGGSGPDYQGENVALKINDVKRILDHAGINY